MVTLGKSTEFCVYKKFRIVIKIIHSILAVLLLAFPQESAKDTRIFSVELKISYIDKYMSEIPHKRAF